jgi:hypothetical protein
MSSFSIIEPNVNGPAYILLNVSFEQPRSIACCPTSLAMLNNFIYLALLLVTQSSDGHTVISPGLIATKGHISNWQSVISPGAVATKGHHSDGHWDHCY